MAPQSSLLLLRHQGKAGGSKTRKFTRNKTCWHFDILDFQISRAVRNTFCSLNHLVCGILLQQSELAMSMWVWIYKLNRDHTSPCNLTSAKAAVNSEAFIHPDCYSEEAPTDMPTGMHAHLLSRSIHTPLSYMSSFRLCKCWIAPQLGSGTQVLLTLPLVVSLALGKLLPHTGCFPICEDHFMSDKL
jgi:hypothetical protein